MIVGVVIVYSFLFRILSNYPSAKLCAAVFADVTSANVVGYQNTTMQSGLGKFSLVSVPFAHVNADGKGIMLNKDITVQGAADPAWGDPDKSDQIWVWNGVGDISYYWYEGSDAPGDETGWWGYSTGNLFETDYKNGLPENAAFIFLARTSDAKVLVGSGAVDPREEISKEVPKNGFTQTANGYPVAFQPNNKKQFLLKGASDPAFGDPDKSDQLWVWNGVGYISYYWYEGSDTPGDETGWWGYSTGNLFETDYPNGIPSGSAFMIKANNVETEREAIYYSPLAKEDK